MSHVYLAPLHCAAVFSANHEHRVVDGMIELNDDASADEHRALVAAGCVREPDSFNKLAADEGLASAPESEEEPAVEPAQEGNEQAPQD